jgi:hypothetical protein
MMASSIDDRESATRIGSQGKCLSACRICVGKKCKSIVIKLLLLRIIKVKVSVPSSIRIHQIEAEMYVSIVLLGGLPVVLIIRFRVYQSFGTI